MGWNTDIFVTNQCRLCSPHEALNNLINAVNERCVLVGASVLSEGIRLCGEYTKAQEIHNKITLLIGYFVDPVHTDFSGPLSLSPFSGNVVRYTEAEIISQIGDSSRIQIGRISCSAKWAFQSYKIINKLKIRIVLTGSTLENKIWCTGNAPGQEVWDTTNTWQDAIDAITASYQCHAYDGGADLILRSTAYRQKLLYQIYDTWYSGYVDRMKRNMVLSAQNYSTIALRLSYFVDMQDFNRNETGESYSDEYSDEYKTVDLSYNESFSGEVLLNDGGMPSILPEPVVFNLSYTQQTSVKRFRTEIKTLSNPPTITYPFEYKDW